jgi:guanylate kinase
MGDFEKREKRYGLALTGLLGVGKSTLAKRLSQEFGMRLMRTVVTRSLEPGEDYEFIRISADEFVARYRRRELLLPFHFANQWYGYDRRDWEEAAREGGRNFVFNVRPYLGLLLPTLLPKLRPAWLSLPEHERVLRMRLRASHRDHVPERDFDVDRQDESYRALYPHVVEVADAQGAVSALLALARE